MDKNIILEIVKERGNFKNIPVVVLSTEGQDEDRKRAWNLGSCDYMVKPFKPTELIAKVNQILSNDRGTISG